MRGGDRAGLPGLETLGDALPGATEADLVGEVVGDGGDGFLPPPLEEEVLDPEGRLLVAHPGHQLGVEVAALGPHAPDVEAEHGLHRPERRGHVVAHDHRHVHRDLEALGHSRQGVEVRSRRWEVEWQPSVGDLEGEGHVLGPFGPEEDRDPGAQRVGDQLQRLAQADRALAVVRQRVVGPGAGDRRLPGHGPAHDVDVLPGPGQRFGERATVPTLGHLRAAHPEAEHGPATRQAVEGDGVHGRRRRRPGADLSDARAELDPRRRSGHRGEGREGVAGPRLSRPQRVIAQGLGPLGGGDQVGGRSGLRRPVAVLIAELQVGHPGRVPRLRRQDERHWNGAWSSATMAP